MLRFLPQAAGLCVPALRARLLPSVRLANTTIAALCFGASMDDGGTADVLALVARRADAPPRLVALELLASRDAAGNTLVTHYGAVSDASRLRLARTTAISRSPTLIARSSWIDYLAWADGGPLTDAPIHPQPADSWAGALASRRVRVRIALAADVAEVTPALLADTLLLRPFRP